MNAFSRSWEITKLSFNVMKQDKELFLFPIIAGIASLAFIAAMAIPTIVTAFLKNEALSGLLFYGILFLIYLGLAIIATFFNVCVVHTVKTRFEGKNATFAESLRFAFSRFGVILAWSLLAATVGLILRAIGSIAERLGGIGELIIKITTSLLGAAWAIITVFVIPSMVYRDFGPAAAIKDSIAALKKTWGESLVRHFGLGIAQFVMILAGVVVFIALGILAAPLGAGGLLTVLALAVLYFVAVIVFFSLANAIFNTALYSYAQTGKVPQGYPQNVVAGAFGSAQR